MFSYFYGEVAWQRRLWYARHPEACRRLTRPVISVGSLTVGGSGKTPVVACLAKLLLAMGERPAILSRGYGRQEPVDGVVVANDVDGVRAGFAKLGDEPLMLARAIPGSTVMVSADRYLAGHLAEVHFGCSVHLLDDGFQHLALNRNLDLLVLGISDLDRPKLLPGGRLRERLETAKLADAILAVNFSEEESRKIGHRLGVSRVFRVHRTLGSLRSVVSVDESTTVAEPGRILAVAGIAHPDRFFEDLRNEGFTIVRTLSFRDHYPFSRRDVDLIVKKARQDRVDLIVTTEKDLMRLLQYHPIGVPLAWAPLAVKLEPAEEFRSWLDQRLLSARTDFRGKDN